MHTKKLIYDASLLVNAYETNLFRTGLFRVCSEVLKRLQQQDMAIYLYDVQGRERILREYILSDWKGCQVLGLHSNQYMRWAYPLLRKADEHRSIEKQSIGLKRQWHRCLKNAYVMLDKMLHKMLPDQAMKQPLGDVHYLSTYYPIPQWVQLYAIPATLIVHDLIPIAYPEWFASTANQQLLQEICNSVTVDNYVVCVSESTRQDFLRFRTDFPSSHVHVAHLAAAEYFYPTPLSAALQTRFAIVPEQYILSVCTLEPRKNLCVVLDVYEQLLQNHTIAPSVKLVLTGAMGWHTNALTDKIVQINTQYPNSVVVTGYLTDEDLAALYSHCMCFVYPSLYEGFGLPPLEAMQCGAPVVTSNVSSLPEVVGDAGITIDPTDLQALMKAVAAISADGGDIYRQRSLVRAKEFSWDRMVEKIINVL